MQASKKFNNKCSENSRSQIVFRTDISRKLTLGAPDYRSAKKGNERCVYHACILGFVLSAMIKKKKRYACKYLVLLNIDQAKVVLGIDPTLSETTSEVNPRASQFRSHYLPRVLFVSLSPSSSPEEPEVNTHSLLPPSNAVPYHLLKLGITDT